MKCPDCGAENIEGAAYCEDCGSKLAMTGAGVAQPAQQSVSAVQAETAQAQVSQESKSVVMPGGITKCGSCGAENPSSETFCEDCGASIGTATPIAVDHTPQVQAPPATSPPQLNVAKLAVAGSSKEFPLNKDVATIGRRSPADGIYPDVDLTDDDPESYISRRHAQIIKQSGQYIFEDVGSANGSFINTVRMTKGVQQELKENDQLRLGKTELIFKIPVA